MRPASSDPDGGNDRKVSRSKTAKRYWSIRPSQKTGIETPMLAPTMVTTSAAELCL